MGQEKCSCKPSESTGVNRLIDELVNAWFNESSGKSLSERQRFGFAFVGSGMFFLVFVPVNFAGSLTNNAALSILSDKGLGISQIIAYAFLAVFAIFIAFIVSWRNTRSGATRLFLSGVLLPTFVLSILSILSIRLG